METIRTTYHLPGLAGARISIDPDKPPVSAAAVGFRKQGNDTRLTKHDKFHIGSLTKAMTATLLAILINDPANHLTWVTTVTEAFPHIANISEAHRNTTLAMLGAHYSGINDLFLATSDFDLWLSLRNESVAPVMGRRIVAEKAFSYAPTTMPGRNWTYSNTNYMILGHLIDMHTPASCGGSWEAAIQAKLWSPLGMHGCGFGTPPEPTLQSIENPWPHAPGNPDPVPVVPDRNSDNPPVLGPAGTVHCTIDSYARFLALHLKATLGIASPVIPLDAFKRLHTPYTTLYPGSDDSTTQVPAYTSGAWILAAPDLITNGSYLIHDGSNTLNYAFGMVAPGLRQAFFSATNEGGELADYGASAVLVGLWQELLGF